METDSAYRVGGNGGRVRTAARGGVHPDGWKASSVLCIAQRPDHRAELLDLVTRMGQLPWPADGLEDALTSLAERHHALCLLALDGTPSTLRTVRTIRARHPETVLIGVADPGHTEQLSEALRSGVFDVVFRPLASADIEALLSNAHQQAALASSGVMPPAGATPWGVFGTSAAMREVSQLVQLAATKRCGILVCGERGTGHEMVARAIHAGSRPQAQFVKVDCQSPTPRDLEIELFGTSRQGASAAFDGRTVERIAPASAFARASAGTLFLENVADLPRELQFRVLRLVRDDKVLLAGDRQPVAIDVRLISAVQPSVATAEQGALHADLYERLSLIRIDLPPLRQRREDIPGLAAHFLKEICRAHGQPPKTLTRPALTLLAALSWPGNARELRSLLERLVIAVPQGIIRLEDVLAHVNLDGGLVLAGAPTTLRDARTRFERDYIEAVVQQQKGRMAKAAEVLGIQRTNLYRKMRVLGLLNQHRRSADGKASE